MSETSEARAIPELIDFLEASIAEKFGEGSKEMLAFHRISDLAWRYSELQK